MQSPQGLLDKVKMLPKLAELGNVFPKTVRSGECQEVVRTEDFSLFDFPILQCWPQDGGRYITWPMVITKNPETGKRNVGCYRMQVFDERTTGMHWQTQKHGAEHYRSALSKNKGGRLEVAVAIGADPATCLSGILPVPPDMDEFLFSGFLRNDPVEAGPCKTVDLGSSGKCGDCARRACRTGRDAHGRPVRRPHRILFAGRAVSGVPRGLRDPPKRSPLSDDHRGPASARGLFHRPYDRTGVSAGDEDAASGDRGRRHAGRRNFSESDDRVHPQKLSRATRGKR